MSEHTHWEVLGLSPGAGLDEIKSAYRRLARDNHPDRNPNDPAAEQRFRRAADAYRALSRKPTAPVASEEAVTATEVLTEVFGEVARTRRRAKRGADTRYVLRRSFLAAMRGGTIKLSVSIDTQCADCSGLGATMSAPALRCERCGGDGEISHSRGFFSAAEPCPDCRGYGWLPQHHCERCDGEGYIPTQQSLTVQIPPGVKDGTRLRVAGRGKPGSGGGKPGDLFVVISVEPHPYWERKGNDLWVVVPVPFATMVLGGTVPIPTLQGLMDFTIEPGTPSGSEFCLQGQGINGGHQHVRLQVDVPEALAKETQDALTAYAKLEDDNQIRSQSWRYLQRMDSDFRSE